MATNPSHHFDLNVHVTLPLSTEQQEKLQELLCRAITLMVTKGDDSNFRAYLIAAGIDENCFAIAFSTSQPPDAHKNDIYITYPYARSKFLPYLICARMAISLYRILRDENGDDVFPQHVTVTCLEGKGRVRALMSSRS